MQEPLEVLRVLHNPVENLSTEEWQTLPEISNILKPFDLVTKKICAEKSVTVSKIIVLVNRLFSACQRINQSLNSEIAKTAMATLMSNINPRFENVENQPNLARAMLLDLCFKKMGFVQQALMKKPTRRLSKKYVHKEMLISLMKMK